MDKKFSNELSDEDLNNVIGGVSIMEISDSCPKCGSQKITTETVCDGNDTKTYKVCKDCGHTW